MKFIKEHIVFVAILSVCIILRLIPLFDYQFTYDELSGLHRTQFSSFGELIEKGVKIDAHPALVQVIIYYLSKCFGYVNWIIKFPFLLFGFAAVIYGYLFSLRNFSKFSAQITASVFSFSLVFVFYAPIARMYISGVFFSIALLYYFFEIIFNNNNNVRNYFLLGLFAWLSALNQHINALFAFTVFLSGFLFLNKQNLKAYFLTCLFVVLAYLPNMGVTLYQLGLAGIGTQQGGWLEKPSPDAVLGFLKVLFGTGKSYWIFVFFVIVSFTQHKKVLFDKKQVLLLALFIVNYLIVYFYSVYRAPIFQYSVMLFSGVCLIMLVTSIIRFPDKNLQYLVLSAISGVLLYKTYKKKDYFNQAVKTVFEYQFERTLHYKKLYGDKNVYPLFFDADSIMRKIYFDKYKTNFEFKMSFDSLISNSMNINFRRHINNKNLSDSVVSSLRLFSDFLANLKSDYVALSSATPLYSSIVADYFPYLIENTQTQGINYKLYSRKKESETSVMEDKVLAYSNAKSQGAFTYSKPELKINDSITLKVDSLTEFPFDGKADYSSFVSSEGQMILVKAKIKSRQKIMALELCNSVQNAANGDSYGYSSKRASDFVLKSDSTLILYSDLYIGRNHTKIKNSSKITTYLWNRGGEKFELLDYEIKLIDYWHQKWHFRYAPYCFHN